MCKESKDRRNTFLEDPNELEELDLLETLDTMRLEEDLENQELVQTIAKQLQPYIS